MWVFFVLILSKQVVLGNTFLSSGLILRAFKKGPEEVLNLYKEHGFVRVSIKVIGDTILIEEGPQFRVGCIKVEGNQAFEDSEILLLLRAKAHKVFNESEFKEDMETIIRKYENSGYPFCKIKIESFELKADSVNFGLRIVEGPLVRINNIKVKGNNFTKDYVILRELRIKNGDIYREILFSEARQRVKKLEFIESAEMELDHESGVLVRVKERHANRVDGAFGYGAPGFMGVLDLEILNLFGTGRAACLKWQRTDTLSTFLELEYKEPWLFGYPVNLISSISHRSEPTYVKNRAELLLDMPITLALRANVGGCGEWVAHSSRYLGILGLDFDTRSGHNLCTGGVHYRAKSEFNLSGLDKVILNFDNYLGWAHSILFFLSLNFGAIFRREIEVYDELKVGGARTLRGYFEEEFSGAQIGWLNIELHKFIGVNRGFIFPFYDFGYIDGNVKQSFGGGVGVNSPIGLVKIVYGLPKGASFMEGKIHLSIKSAF